jgi:uncharacterized protein affecting Mg2+/Co2+ transport
MQQTSFWFSPAGGATIALAGVAIAVISSSFWAVMNRRWQIADHKRQIAIEKGEQVYGLIKRWKDYNTTWFSHCKLVMTDQIDYNEFLDISIKEGEKFDSQVDKIDFIIAVHFPELSDDWDRCVKLVWASSEIESQFKNDYKAGIHTGAQHLPNLRQATLDAYSQLEATLRNLAKSARSKL